MASTAIRRMGNSHGVILPKTVLSNLGLKAGDAMGLSIEDGRIVLTPVSGSPRAGWAEAAAVLAMAEDDRLVWPDFPNAGDDTLEW